MKTKPILGNRIDKMLGVVLVVAVISCAIGVSIGLVKAYQSKKANTVIENAGGVTINNQGDNLSDTMIGGEATTTPQTITEFNDLAIKGCVIRMDSEVNSGNWYSQTYWDCVEVIPLPASTSTAVWQNRKGKPIWVDGLTTLTIGTMATTSARFTVGTSTSQFLNPYDSTIQDTAKVNGANSILRTGTVAFTAPSTTLVFTKQDYEGADTRDGSGSYFLVPVLEGQYVTLFASTTNGFEAAATSSDRALSNVNLFLHYRIYN